MYVIHDISGTYVLYCVLGIFGTSGISVIYAIYVTNGIYGLFDISATNGTQFESVTQAMPTSNGHVPPAKPLHRMTYMAYLS